MTILALSKMNKKSCVLCGHFISLYKINRTLHGRAGIRILSSRAENNYRVCGVYSPEPRAEAIVNSTSNIPVSKLVYWGQ